MEDETQLIAALRGTRAEYDEAVRQLCENKELQQAATALVKKLGGNDTDAEDTFWQSLEALILNISKGRFKENSALKTYFLAICKNIFLKQRQPVYHMEEEKLAGLMGHSLSPEDLHIERGRDGQLVALYRQLIEKVGDKCKKIFEMLKRGASMQALAEELGHEKVQSAQNAAYRCREKLRKMILEDSNLRKRIEELL